ncbi:MAG: helveticin J family class III bacteriocin, partial [Lachnospiraceae bacterium]|nr:helveticin J family class III bacteriocin [Lachnospiraceae bacterium]
ADTTISNYTKICRFANLDCANDMASSFGNVKRVDAALSEDQSKIVFWIQNTNNEIQYSAYDFLYLNQLLDEKENQSSKYVSFSNNLLIAGKCTFYTFQSVDGRILPNDSFQGLDLTNDGKVYVAGGNQEELPQVALLSEDITTAEYKFDSLGTVALPALGSTAEVEAVKIVGNSLYFGICDHSVKSEKQYIYTYGKAAMDASALSHNLSDQLTLTAATCTTAGSRYLICSDCGLMKQETVPATGHLHTEIRNASEATCAVAGYTGDTYCSDCNTKLSSGTAIPVLSHSWDSGKVTKAAGANITGTKTYTCTKCGQTKTETIKATGAPKKGTKLRSGSVIYQVTKAGLTGGTVTYRKTSSTAKKISIPATVSIEGITYKVTGVGKEAFKNNKTITQVTIGSQVTSISQYAFAGCTKLKKVTMGSNVTSIGDRAFYKCSVLAAITIPKKVAKIGVQAFYQCKKLKTITIKTTKLNKNRIGKKAFSNIYSKAVIKAPAKKKSTYKTILRQKGIGSKVTVK